jgi:CheY-like chemotaxis protein
MTTILVADDEESIRQTVRLFLEDEGYQVLEAATTDAAMQYLSTSTDPLIVLLDLFMPSSTLSLPLLIADSAALQARHRFILFTARTGTSEQTPINKMIELAQSFVQATIIKPFELEELLTTIRQVETMLAK